MQDSVIEIVNTANQRGGRMLSVIDLIERDTLTLNQAALLTHRVALGDSFLVGARPGGAGKTTVMCALLAMLPPHEDVVLTAHGNNWTGSTDGNCVVAYEISPGPYLAYIWDKNVRAFLQLGINGNRIVTNLHADTFQEAYDQIVIDNGAAPELFDAFDIFLPVHISGSFFSAGRTVPVIHRKNDKGWEQLDRRETPTDYAPEAAAFLNECLQNGITTVQDVRKAWLDSGVPQSLT